MLHLRRVNKLSKEPPSNPGQRYLLSPFNDYDPTLWIEWDNKLAINSAHKVFSKSFVCENNDYDARYGVTPMGARDARLRNNDYDTNKCITCPRVQFNIVAGNLQIARDEPPGGWGEE